MKKIFLLIGACIAFAITAQAQNSDNKWAVDYSYSGLNYAPFYEAPTNTMGGVPGIFEPAYWNNGAKIGVARNFLPFLNAYGNFGVHSLSNIPGNFNSVASIMVDLGAQFRLANGSILRENHWFDPYINIGGGVNWIDNKAKGFVEVGGGINFWLVENVGITFGLGHQIYLNELKSFDQNPTGSGASYGKNMRHTVGLKFRWGAKDTDGDGISDKEDACPDVKGLEAFKGCPDTDGDGIPDKDDACPDKAGSKDFNGCPDSDKDGIADKDDACPDVAGIASLQGCPDADGDGIADKDDECPTVKGLASFKGCPDSDGDGVQDKDDACPNEAGIAQFNGCPDTDGDGIQDKEDKCPTVPGVASEQGCPEKKVAKEEIKEVEKKLQMAASRIQFETGKSTILRVSFAELDKLLPIMKQYPGAEFRIEGHTDNVGNAVANKNLSQQRADAVKAYFVSKGIKADRLSSNGFGQEKPLGSNATPAGRTQNRRVEIHLAD
ncbi:MAG: OmpA family protein [Cytophagia bacterium]|nr:MAG: OmpA family protein [Cytophagia bacterium]TAG42904.1 MAG: OmpA family protein [Cytophagia bacterium]TAH31012.1 MAG: OmpA family protein [Cytophagales bacterium]